MTEQFYFDDFFVSDSDYVEHKLLIKNRYVPIKFKRSFSLEDIQAAQSLSIETSVNLITKNIELKGVDHTKFLKELIPRSIVDWPFVNRDGRKVPINKETCGQLLLEVATPIITIVEGMTKEMDRDTSFFENKSGEASLKKAQEKLQYQQVPLALESHATKNSTGHQNRSKNYHTKNR